MLHTRQEAMRTKHEHDDEDPAVEILRRALAQSESAGDSLHQRLSAAAEELGISPEALRSAEASYRRDKRRSDLLARFRKENKQALHLHAMIYVIVNACLVGLNLLTWHEDRQIWFPYALLGWGIGLLIHAAVAFRRADWDSEEFQDWLSKRKAENPDDAP